ncbi:MAG: 30S ribosomal protein S9 [Planctomycetota bacterium]|nr:30S ribosomal protein S9 [Planctomycetota bacterium]
MKTKEQYIWGTGRRKTSVARVRIKPGSGRIVVNERPFEEYFAREQDKREATAPLVVTEKTSNYDVAVNVKGGGIHGQAGAVSLGLARALAKAERGLEPKLREAGLLTRDPREVERKKYGYRKARRGFQFSKR